MSSKQPATSQHELDVIDAVVLKTSSEIATEHAQFHEAHCDGFGQDDVVLTTMSARDIDLVQRRVRSVNVSVRDLKLLYHPGMAPSKILGSFSKKKEPSGDVENPQVKAIIDGVSAHMPAGSLTAIMGSSGSGKTSLLNTIAHRVASSKLEVTGELSYNASSNHRAVRSAYVMQQDLLLPTLTVRETLQYAADLRLPSLPDQAQRRAVVESVILELGLKDCADTRIGSNVHKGCSGGEKRRVSIGVQMLANPSVLYCDEPTTGLDAYSAYQVVRTLKRLAQNGRTVIISIHTPRSEIWSLFDRVILLARGQTLYSGPTEAVLPHFAACGHIMPAFVNPAEFVIDLAAVDNRNLEVESASLARVDHLRRAWQQQEGALLPSKDSDPALSDTADSTQENERGVGFNRQVRVLTQRGIKVCLRDPMSVLGTAFEVVVMSFISGWVFYQLPADLAGIKSRIGALYTGFVLQSYLILLIEIYRLTSEFRLFDLERAENAVGIPAFLISRRLARVFLEDIPVPLVFTLIFYFMVGFRADAATFFIFLFTMIVSQYVTVCFAAVCVAFTRDFAGASLFANLFYTVNSFACGFFVNADQIPVYTRWLKWCAPNFFLLGAFVNNEFIGVNSPTPLGQIYDCPLHDPNNTQCSPYIGKYTVQSLAFPSTNWIWRPIGISIAFAIIFYLFAAAVLKLWVYDIGVVGARKQEDDNTTAGTKDIKSAAGRPIQPVALGLDDYSLEVRVRKVFRKSTNKTILHPITAKFAPGAINVIMGPSGSGKTSLLQGLAHRLHGGVMSTYISSGNITLNNATPTATVLKSVTSFVTQDDDALMPSLTVRETLRFAAGLRLPSWMSKEEKHRRAEEVLLRMGLKECADRPIGSNLKKGISGGEKRRVSIAIQILTDPRVILLDEPTSGLDAFLASSVISVLKTLAEEGRTVIMTIHQARSDLIKDFDNVLLLARGGSLVYTGPTTDMLPYFSDLGFECPTNTNPTDFVLDLITIDLQEEEKEAASREKVQHIIHSWQERSHSAKDIVATAQSIASPAELNSLKRETNPFYVTFPLIIERSIIDIKRNFEIIMARTMQVLGLAIVMALFFAPLKNNYESIQSRIGFIQEICAFYFVGMLQNLAVYPMVYATFRREHADGCYSSTTFLLHYTLLELPFTALSSIIFGILGAFAINSKRTAAYCFITALNCFCIVTTGESIGIVFCALFEAHEGFSVNVMSTIISISVTMAGLFSLNMPSWLKGLNYLSPLKYLVGNLVPYMMQGQKFSCGVEQQGPDGQCTLGTGEQVLQLYGFTNSPAVQLGALVACTVIYRALSFVILWALRR